MEYITPEDYERAAANGIDAKNLEQRIRCYHWSMKRATTQKLGRRNAWGWNEWKKTALAHGIEYDTYIHRVKNMGMSHEEAATSELFRPATTGKRAAR